MSLANLWILAIVASIAAGCSDHTPTVTYHAENRSGTLYFVEMTGARSGRFVYLPPHSASTVFDTLDQGRVQATVYLEDCRRVGQTELDPEHTNLRIGDSGSVSTTSDVAQAAPPAPTPLDGFVNNPGGGFCLGTGWWIGARNDSGEPHHIETPYVSFLMPPHTRGIVYGDGTRPFPPDVFAVVHDADCAVIARQELGATHRILVIAEDGVVSAQPATAFWASSPSPSELYVRGAETARCGGASGSSISTGSTP